MSLKILLKFLIALLSIGGFLWLCMGQIEKFLSNKTSVSVAWKRVEDFEAPTLVFCNQIPYIDGKRNELMSRVEYDEKATKVNALFWGKKRDINSIL